MAYTTIDKPDDYFNTLLRNGTGTGNTAITGVGFQPDLVWQKRRNTTGNHFWTDSVRGSSKKVYSNTTDAEETDANWVVSFDSDGYTMGSSDYGTSDTVASWNWKAGGTASSNTDGSITSSVSANTIAGFSIVSWSADGGNTSTAGHSLGTTPQIIIYKSRGSGAWYVWLNQIIDSSNDYLLLNNTNAKADIDTSTYGTPSSTTISNFGFTSGENMIAYCFAEKKGYSKFGSYTGNGNADGTFVYTGFKPAWIMIKRTTSTVYNWIIFDNKRNTFNVLDNRLRANTSDAEQTNSTTHILDFVSNGFKIRSSNSAIGGGGDPYIYMCFAESPFTTSTGIPTTAR